MPRREATYPPLNTLKPVADAVWIVDGPMIRFDVLGLRLPFPTRMTLIRLAGGLFVHSPTPLTPARELERGRAHDDRMGAGADRPGTWPLVRAKRRGRIAPRLPVAEPLSERPDLTMCASTQTRRRARGSGRARRWPDYSARPAVL